MSNTTIHEIKAFVPARDFETSLQFYQDMGFELRSNGGGIAYLCCEERSFLLQNFYVEQHASNFMMHLLVTDVQAWFDKVTEAQLVQKYGVRQGALTVQPYFMRDFTLTDPSGVLWVIGENIPGGLHV